MIEIKNAIIKSMTMSTADHGVLSSFINLDFGGTGQGFGGYALHNPHRAGPNYAGHFIWRCLEIAGVSEWADLVGRPVRAKAEPNRVHAIGHILLDKWFDPAKEFENIEEVYKCRSPLST